MFARAAASPEPHRTPNWSDDILPMMTEPHWVSGDPKTTGQSWIGAMKYYGVGGWRLDSYDDVKARAVSIYQHVRTKTMPITRDPRDFWPDDVVETFRLWANAGCPKDASDTPSPQMLIPKPVEPRDEFSVRRDIMSLTKEELARYQAKLDDVLQVGVLGSPWQKLGVLHAYWCLHYQEATFLWHRAYLLYVEKLIGMPIPYWNGYAAETADPTSPYAGIPPMFFEETYVHPDDGSVRPNPLKYALALEGKSKSGQSQFVTRSPTLVNGPSDPDWDRKIGLFNTYHGQLQHCLEQKTYTSDGTAEEFGRPWANIPTFSDDQLDELYQFRFDFDGLFEQVHDNFHGWVGPDMADNTYTANDPIFLSYHANMDRLAGIFMDAHPSSQVTSSYPLQPFVDNGTAVSYDDPRRWRYTTVGDMAKDTRSLGYMYGAPVCADLPLPKSAAERRHMAVTPAGGRAITVPAQVLDRAKQLDSTAATNGDEKPSRENRVPYVIFANVGCTTSSYRVDVFTQAAKPPLIASLDNEDYIGEVTRIGMGPGVASMGAPDNKARRACRQPSATRVLSAKNVWYKKKQAGKEGDLERVQIVVTDLATGQAVSKEEYGKMSGFEPRVVWLPESTP
ncbi:hypothetical protein Micbo1qcDRAFT_150590 [Microdochium bolleyi]|uniref:tyrosinase n=1 Tax=Microdochium bolleyi TaxID=196109 RepID=A0A136IUL0_9PEZI|nr:hypothetical protein Micbo1qcDRAFT_150590 [Microdochium bolleyi]